MAERRMFTKKIIDSDAFLDMPLSTQALYFHLNMRADDDGFVNNPKKICRMIGACDDDLRVLISKRFVLTFDSGVIVIKHWRMHNLIKKDRYKETEYQDEKDRLFLKKNGSYTDTNPNGTQVEPIWNPNGTQVEPQVRLGKVIDRVGKCSVVEQDTHTQLGNEILTVEMYNTIISKIPKSIVDDVIHRIIEKPYYGCLNPETIEKWCFEVKNHKSNNKFNNFEQRKYDFDELEKKLLDC